MSTRWKATMPKIAPKPDLEHFVFAASAGPKLGRMELVGQMSADQRKRILAILMEKA